MRIFVKALLINFCLISASYASGNHLAFTSCEKSSCQSEFSQFKKLAINGSPDAQMILATMYYTGYGIEKDANQSLYWFKKAGKQEIPQAHYRSALLYLFDKDIDRNISRGIALLKRAIKGGNSDAAFRLADLYEQGLLVAKDSIASKKWLNRGHELTVMDRTESSKALVNSATKIEHITIVAPTLDDILKDTLVLINDSGRYNSYNLKTRHCILCTTTSSPSNFHDSVGLFRETGIYQ